MLGHVRGGCNALDASEYMGYTERPGVALPSGPPDSHAKYSTHIQSLVREQQGLLAEALAELTYAPAAFSEACALLVHTLRSGHKVLTAGNGGSAAEAQHFSAELVGRFLRDRAPYAAIALTTDSCIMTAVANDYGYEHVFARQVRALGRPGDLFVPFSTSGESESVVQGALTAKQCGMSILAVTGATPNRLEQISDVVITVSTSSTPVVQQLHMMVTHILSGIVESELSEDQVLT